MATIQEAFADLSREVSETQGAQASAIALIQGLRAKIDELVASGSITPEQLAELSAQLDASANELGAAVAANPVP